MMTDQEHAEAIKQAAAQLQLALSSASSDGLTASVNIKPSYVRGFDRERKMIGGGVVEVSLTRVIL